MHALDTFGVPDVLTPKRRVDWTEPPAEGEWDLVLTLAGDDDE